MVLLTSIEFLNTRVLKNINIIDNVYKISISLSSKVDPGQFFMLRAWRDEPLLSRPVSVYNVENNIVSFLYQVVGLGTEILSKLKSGEKIDVLGPLGNGFPVDEIHGNIAIITGGIGIAPMFYVSKLLKDCNIDLYSGYKDEVYAIDLFKNYVNNIYVSTENGNVNAISSDKRYKDIYHFSSGYVTDIFASAGYDMVLCCGPEVMMNKVMQKCKISNVPIYVSMESHMACGIGACLVCTCKTKNGNKRTCKDGPVFNGEELVINE